jgi:hypothetical protein
MTRRELLERHDFYVSLTNREAYQAWIRQLSFADTTELQEAIADRKRGK